MDDIDAIEVFTRINIGKIPLTNAELVKAVFLSKNNLSLGYASENEKTEDFTKILSLKQNAIALEWDQMEKVLQDEKVWGFIYSGDEEYETRIDYLLDLLSKKTEKNDKYHSFRFFYNGVKEVRNNKSLLTEYAQNNRSIIEEEWNKLKQIFDILQEWYTDKIYNHLVGYLISQKISIAEIVQEFKEKDRATFLQYLKRRIASTVNVTNLSALHYDSNTDKGKIQKILLLHNVLSSLSTNDTNAQFPFNKLKSKAWTLEHIFAQNSEELREEDYKNWLEDHLEYFKTKEEDKETSDINRKITSLLSEKATRITKEKFQDCFNSVSGYIQKKIRTIDGHQQNEQINETSISKSEEWLNNDHSLANLALMDGSMNSAIQNSLFDIKRRMVLDKDKQGEYIPSETKKVFLKYYTATPGHLSYWTLNDRRAYINNIQTTLNYLNQN